MSTLLRVNGRAVTTDLPDDTPLLWVLRDGLNMTGTKYGCGQGLCGACTVQMDGVAVRSCITPLADAVEADIRTIEQEGGRIEAVLRQAWQDHNVAQCGYCQAGQIMAAAALLAANPAADEAAVREALSGNLCRCGTYSRIVAAVLDAAKRSPTGG